MTYKHFIFGDSLYNSFELTLYVFWLSSEHIEEGGGGARFTFYYLNLEALASGTSHKVVATSNYIVQAGTLIKSGVGPKVKPLGTHCILELNVIFGHNLYNIILNKYSDTLA